MYLDIITTSDTMQFWVEYQNNTIGWTGVVFDSNLNVQAVSNTNTFNISYENKILKFQFTAGLYSGLPSYITMTLKDSNVGDQIIFDDFMITKAVPKFSIDFSSETVGDSAPKNNPSQITNVYNKSADSVTIDENNGNKYLLIQKSSSGSASFYFNSIGFLKNEQLYHVELDIIEHNATEIIIAYNDPEDPYKMTFSSIEFVSSTGDPYLLNPSFDGKILSFDIVPSQVLSKDHYQQFAVTFKGNGNLVAKIKNVKIEQIIDETKDVIFKKDANYTMEDILPSTPKTFMANLNLKSYQTKGGVLLGNYMYNSNAINYEIIEGKPSVTYFFADGTSTNYLFDAVNVRSDNFVTLTIVTETNKIKCYLNGELKQTLDYTSGDISLDNPFVIGGDSSVNNNDFFRGKIRNVSLWSDARTAEEVLADITEIDLNDENLLVSYDFTGQQDSELIEDANGNIDVVLQGLWLDEDLEEPEYDYSFAIVGDTQILTSFFPNDLHHIYDYLSTNIEEKNIKYVFGMGDITDKDTEEEWQLAMGEIAKLDGIVPYSLTRGNHDGDAQYNKYLGEDSIYAKQYFLRYNNDSTTTAHKFSAGKLDYLVITLDFGPTDDELAWANEVVAAHPNHNVIVTTHAYLNNDGTYLDSNDSSSPSNSGKPGAKQWNDGDDIFEKFVKKHENIVLVLSGHVDANGVVMKTALGENGNKIVEMLINPQGLDLTYGSTGLISMLYFSENGSKVDLQYYSTVLGQYKTNSTYSFTVNTIAPKDRVDSVEVSIPENFTHKIGEELKVDDIVVVQKWFSGAETTLTSQEYTVRGYNKNLIGTQTVTITDGEFSFSFEVTVEDYVVSREVTMPNAKEYKYGDQLKLSDFLATVTWASGRGFYLTSADCEVTGYDKNQLGTQTVAIDVCGQDYTYEVVVNDFVQSISIVEPTKTAYKLLEELDLTGLVVKEVYASGAEQEIESDKYNVSGYNKNLIGTQQIKITAGKYSSTFEVTVEDYVVSREVTLPTNRESKYGEDLNLSGFSAKVTWASGKVSNLTFRDASGRSIDDLLKAMKEAESYDGPSLIIAYAPCISHGIKTGMANSQDEAKKAVECGYWGLYRYNPSLIGTKNPFSLDSKEPKESFREFIMGQVRYSALEKQYPDMAAVGLKRALKYLICLPL